MSTEFLKGNFFIAKHLGYHVSIYGCGFPVTSMYIYTTLIDKEIPVTVHNFKNAKSAISIYPEESVNRLLKKNEDFSYSTGFEIYELKAPLLAGDVVGKMFVFDKNNMVINEVNLIAGEHAKEIGFSELFGKVIGAW